MMERFAPGDLVFARGREWVALPSGESELRLRPLSGGEGDVQVIVPALERVAPRLASFAPPRLDQTASQDGARLLAEALRMSLRRGAGPFRAAGQLAFEPRAYQLVPLLMALKLPVPRLLIADDVGIGKTVEAGLVLRELMDRGEVERFAVLCPPHLVEQWVGELKDKFDLDAAAVTASSAPRLERGLPSVASTLFDAYPHTVVSLDYIKAEKRRETFARACPGFVIVDEAHACVGAQQGRQQRFELLRRLAEDPRRAILFLTATPHSGDVEAFGRLLGLVDPSLSAASLDSDQGRVRLARHFVQRRRIDVTGRDWGEDRVFPKHDTKEQPYALDADHRAFHEAVLDWCLGVVQGAGDDQRSRRLAFWGTLALMRCVGSSPAAAASALRNRLEADQERLDAQVFDEDAEEGDAVDVEPASGLAEAKDGELAALVTQAERLARSRDPKLDAAIAALRPLLKPRSGQPANPVVFCRFIATAEHVAAGLKKAFPEWAVECITGALTADERRARVEAMGEHERRLLVATDCLSEGINLQALFDAVLHYDLSWNPTRHQQREGRVDRFGQRSPLVRSMLLYSPDSAIDGAVLEVILRKAEAIRKATGVTVPLPDEKGAVAGALMNAVLLRRTRKPQQLGFDFGPALAQDARAMETRWRDAEDGERRSRARFAQNALAPALVRSEWSRWRELLGGPAEVERFVQRAMSRLDAPLEAAPRGVFRAETKLLPAGVRERLAARGVEGRLRLAFDAPEPGAQAELVSRAHPLVATLADALVEGALDPASTAAPSLGRAGAWLTPAVKTATLVVLLRLRHKLAQAPQRRLLLAEEAACLAFGPSSDEPALAEAEARALLEVQAAGDLAPVARERLLNQALERVGPACSTARSRPMPARVQAHSPRTTPGCARPRAPQARSLSSPSCPPM